MKDEKKIFLFLACCLLVVALTGCSRDDKTTTNTGTSAAVTTEAATSSSVETSSATDQTNGSVATPTPVPGGSESSSGELGSLADDVKDGLEDAGTDLGLTASPESSSTNKAQ